ncbi:54S ribosomal protein img2, mitochondrial [Schizosaccharomyces pombe]|uniref:Large ribosomal subunit protein mL49 n=1 Tax=Schizosaccharomyces pombe (strain 972 / ATCC 24843) TaxID=284812 RepID=IMG2_SCHPO|nr:putative mitochondrial ribosomal protein subunit Img2 [Schizosaccharomyces pombe]Q10139.1 RecName: Full=Large ribosomal subunit protein mL49; AltName: Full=54S ribosomal protein img2, mitochondrial; AltName: Full=Integrity of mitochondrial genome protein 2; Flags: Precursor [Schizosaccharomyces pombe 972h-]CAA93160.1 mitochondrial ribosomal protein subunit Img2 (predicted) [Schizosaccharomyces pombe]|eukprot:NP_592996.1 putative mitochondrial ribosomal protein subunit Img2 [Schizosaccharomyces pombe]
MRSSLKPVLSNLRFNSTIASESLRFHVSRTPSKNLPVYLDYKQRGTKILTLIRKIHGDSNALRLRLISTLKMSPKDVYVNKLTNQVVLKGNHIVTVREWLQDQGF